MDKSTLKVGQVYHNLLDIAVSISWTLSVEEKKELIQLLLTAAASANEDVESIFLRETVNYIRMTEND